MKNEELESFGVIPDRPPSLDEKGFRLFVIPAPVKGFFRKRRDIVYSLLLLIFLVLPWTRFAGEQTILLELTTRRFVFFGQTFLAHDGPYLFFFLILAALGLVFVTSVWGRLWCGWACPQTVFIDFIYRRIEAWVEGNHLERRKLGKSPWSISKLSKKIIKWILFFLVSSHIAHSFTAYFVGAQKLIWITMSSPAEHWGLFLWVQAFTLVTLIDFGWFREQFCLIACPYGRFQSALMEKNSLAIMYDFHRGEPRKKKGLKEFGDCIDCKRCVNVCPTGIDIREGIQMECIACTSCADACDEVMQKLNKPLGLIRYSCEAEMTGGKRQFWTPRTITYICILLALSVASIVSFNRRPNIDVKVLRAIEAPYTRISQGQYQNHFRLHITNQSDQVIQIQEIKLDRPELKLIAPQVHQQLEPNQNHWLHIFVVFRPEQLVDGELTTKWILLTNLGEDISGPIKLLGPRR